MQQTAQNVEVDIISAVKARLINELTPSKLLFHTKINVDGFGHVVKKNSRPIWRGRIGKSKTLISAEAYITACLARERMRAGINSPINQKIWAMLLFYCKDFYTKKKVMSLTLGDQSNLYQLPEDCLQKAKIIQTDALICSHDLSRRLPSTDGKDWLEIFILEFSQ